MSALGSVEVNRATLPWKFSSAAKTVPQGVTPPEQLKPVPMILLPRPSELRLNTCCGGRAGADQVIVVALFHARVGPQLIMFWYPSVRSWFTAEPREQVHAAVVPVARDHVELASEVLAPHAEHRQAHIVALLPVELPFLIGRQVEDVGFARQHQACRGLERPVRRGPGSAFPKPVLVAGRELVERVRRVLVIDHQETVIHPRIGT